MSTKVKVDLGGFEKLHKVSRIDRGLDLVVCFLLANFVFKVFKALLVRGDAAHRVVDRLSVPTLQVGEKVFGGENGDGSRGVHQNVVDKSAQVTDSVRFDVKDEFVVVGKRKVHGIIVIKHGRKGIEDDFVVKLASVAVTVERCEFVVSPFVISLPP